RLRSQANFKRRSSVSTVTLKIAIPHEPAGKPWMWIMWFLLLAFVANVAAMVFGGELAVIAVMAWQVLPVVVLAFLAYKGLDCWGARRLSVMALGVIGIIAGVMSIGLTAWVLNIPSLRESGADPAVIASATTKMALVSGGVGVALLIVALGFLAPVRRALARVLP